MPLPRGQCSSVPVHSRQPCVGACMFKQCLFVCLYVARKERDAPLNAAAAGPSARSHLRCFSRCYPFFPNRVYSASPFPPLHSLPFTLSAAAGGFIPLHTVADSGQQTRKQRQDGERTRCHGGVVDERQRRGQKCDQRAVSSSLFLLPSSAEH